MERRHRPDTFSARVSGTTGRSFGAALMLMIAAPPSFGDTGGVEVAGRGLPITTLGVHHDSLLDEVDHAPNAQGGGFLEPRTRQRFAATTVSLGLPELGRGSVALAFGSYRLVTLRDDLQIHGLKSDASWRLTPRSASLQLRALVGLSGNRASAFDKNSWTEVDGATLTRTRIDEPSDLQASVGMAADMPGIAGIRLNGFARLGVTRVRHDQVTGTGLDSDGCRYTVEASGSGASIRLAEPCGRIQAYTESHPDEQGLADRYGIAPSRDLDWQAAWLEAGAGASWAGERLSVALDWRYRHYRRDGIDERIEAAGERARRVSHVLSFEAGWAFTRRLSIAAGVDWRVAPWLDGLPLMYNRFTSHRQDTELPSFRLGLVRSFGTAGR